MKTHQEFRSEGDHIGPPACSDRHTTDPTVLLVFMVRTVRDLNGDNYPDTGGYKCVSDNSQKLPSLRNENGLSTQEGPF